MRMYTYIYIHRQTHMGKRVEQPLGVGVHDFEELLMFAGESRKQVGSPSAHPGGMGMAGSKSLVNWLGVNSRSSKRGLWTGNGDRDVSQTVFYGIGTLNPSFYYRWSLVLVNRFGHDEWVLVSRFLIMSYFSSSKQTLILLAFPAFPGFPYFCRAHQRYLLTGHLRNLNWRYLLYIRPIFQAYVREHP